MSSSGSIPAVGVAVMLRTLSTPEPLPVKAEFLQTQHHLDHVARGDLANLQVGACGDVQMAATPILGHVGEAVQLRGGQLPGGDAHPQHERFLRRADVEHAVVTEVERVLLVGQLVAFGMGQEAVPGVEAVLLQLPEFGFGKLGNRRAENIGLGGFGGRGGVG